MKKLLIAALLASACGDAPEPAPPNSPTCDNGQPFGPRCEGEHMLVVCGNGKPEITACRCVTTDDGAECT